MSGYSSYISIERWHYIGTVTVIRILNSYLQYLKEVAVGTCEMTPEMFQEAIKITKEAITCPTNAEAAKKIKSSFDEKYGGNWMAIVGEGYGLFFAHKAENFAHF